MQGSASSNAIYEETHTKQTDENGLINLEIGMGVVVSGDFSSIDWSIGSYFLQVETDPTGGTTYSIAGVSQLLSVPYALYAKTSGGVSGGSQHYIGELFGGGIVFYVYDNGQHGLISSLEDLTNNGKVWWGPLEDIDTNEWDGAFNTTNAAAVDGSVIKAIGLCDSYSAGGFSDWYLPAQWELNSLFNASFIVSKILNDDGDDATQPLLNDSYWSSSNFSYVQAFSVDFSKGTINASIKGGGVDNQQHVRAVRAF